LLNNNRTPFLPAYPQPITYSDRENAIICRIEGREIPKPQGDGGRLAEIILKACAYSIKDRYSSPAQMRAELEALLHSHTDTMDTGTSDIVEQTIDVFSKTNHQIRNDTIDKTERVFSDDSALTKRHGSSDTNERKNKKAVFAVAGVIGIALLAVVMFVMLRDNTGGEEVPLPKSTNDVSDPTPVEEISLDIETKELCVGDQFQLDLHVVPEDAAVSAAAWSSSDDGVVSVSESGMITANAAGAAKITVSCDGKTASIDITVVEPTIEVTDISLDMSTLDLDVGEEAALAAAVDPSNATFNTISWTSSDPQVASVNNGLVVGNKAGSAVITAACDTQGVECVVNVSPVIIPVNAVALSQTDLTIDKGTTANLAATISPSNATEKKITWSSSDTSVAVVNNGVVTAVEKGSAVIIASCGGIISSCNVVVEIPTTDFYVWVNRDRITRSYDSYTMGGKIGDNYAKVITLNGTKYPMDSSDTVLWSNSNPAVAVIEIDPRDSWITPKENTATSRIIIRAVGAGTTRITAKCGNHVVSIDLTVGDYQ